MAAAHLRFDFGPISAIQPSGVLPNSQSIRCDGWCRTSPTRGRRGDPSAGREGDNHFMCAEALQVLGGQVRSNLPSQTGGVGSAGLPSNPRSRVRQNTLLDLSV